MLVLALPVLGLSFAQADTAKVFKPSPEPVFSTPRAKPNIHMVLDDSGSMKTTDVPETVGGRNILRTVALDRAVSALLRKYRDKAYLGVSFLWQGDSTTGLVALPINDFSKYEEKEFETKIVQPISKKILNAPGNTPVSRGVYEAMKAFRGQPLNKAASNGTNKNLTGYGSQKYYQYTDVIQTPLRYRCQQNHMVVMTDGQPNDNYVYGVAVDDKDLYKNAHLVNQGSFTKIENGVDMSRSYSYTSSLDLGKIAANLDLRNAYKPHIVGYEKDRRGNLTNIPIWEEKVVDDAGKPWFDKEYSIPMPLYMHTVSLYVKPDADVYTGLTSPTSPYKEKPGMNLGFAKGQGSAEDLLLAFDTIFSSIILSTSSTLSMNDRIHSDMLTKAPTVDKDGNVDLRSLGTIRYDTIYDFRQNFGSVRAMVPYISGYDASKKDPKKPKDKGEAIIATYELWSTDKSITPTQGRYVTLANTDPGMNLLELTEKKIVGGKEIIKVNQEALKQFQAIDSNFDANYIDWLTNFKKTDNLNGMRGRLNPLGSITNSDITTVNKDILNINVNEKMMGKAFSLGLNQWLLYKAQHQPKNLLIVGDNDGFISFINAQRGLTGSHKGGQRDTAYFPQMLVPRFKEIAGLGLGPKQSLVMDGRTNLVDAKVYQEGDGDLYATLGLTAMGGGGKGLVGYRIYADNVKAVDDWVSSGRQKSDPKEDSIYHKVTPLFEITDETSDFGDLGYTYSGFEFFNRFVEGKGQAVAVFGNGFGTDKSVLYFIDAYTGEKLHEIVLNPNGMGAATPSIIVSADGRGGQKIDRVYVGDYSGTLYKVEFDTNDFTSSTAKVTALFKAPETNFGQSAIAVKPLVVKAKNSNAHRVFFGTGLAASHELDRGDHSLVTHAVYGIIDLPSKYKKGSTKLSDDKKTILEPLFTVENLKKGYVNYKNKSQLDYEKLGQHDLELHAPSSQPNDSIENGTDNGWYMILAADNNGISGSGGAYNSKVGTVGSGERVIRDPQYDSEYDAVVFSTWAIRERDSELTTDIDKDPCISDLAYGKVLSLNITTGRAASKVSITNKGTTGTAQGVLTGDSIVSAPEGNNSSKLSDLDQVTQYNIVNQKEKDKTTGEDTIKSEGVVDDNNSSYEMDNEKSGVYCLGGINGALECEEVARKPGGGGTDPVDPIDPIKPDPIDPDPTNPVNPKVKGFQRQSIQTLLNA